MLLSAQWTYRGRDGLTGRLIPRIFGFGALSSLHAVSIRPMRSIHMVRKLTFINVAISVCCLSAFPQLFRRENSVSKPKYNPSESYRGIINRMRPRTNVYDMNGSLFDTTLVSQSGLRHHDIRDEESCIKTQEEQLPPITATYYPGAPGDKRISAGGITRERGYQVVHSPPPREEC